MPELVQKESVNVGEDHIGDGEERHQCADGTEVHELSRELRGEENLLVAVVEEEAEQQQHARFHHERENTLDLLESG